LFCKNKFWQWLCLGFTIKNQLYQNPTRSDPQASKITGGGGLLVAECNAMKQSD